jgi:uncharacterized membrane protein
MKYKNGIIFAFITAIISGISIFYNKLVIVSGIDPLVLNIIKNGGAAIILTIILFSSSIKQELPKLKKRDWLRLVTIALIGGSIPFILYFEGLRTVTASNANFIHKTLFLYVAGMAIPILHEKLNIFQIIGYFVLLWGNIILSGLPQMRFGSGEMFILCATLLWSLEAIIAKVTLQNIDSKIVSWARMFLGCILLIIYALIQGKLPLILGLDPKYIFPIFISSILLASYAGLYFKALNLAPTTYVTAILILATPVTNILYGTFINGNIPQLQIFNIIITLTGLIFLLPVVRKISLKR